MRTTSSLISHLQRQCFFYVAVAIYFLSVSSQAQEQLQAPEGFLTPGILVWGEHLSLQMLLPGIQEPWARLDLGATPAPLQKKIINKQHLQQALQRAGLPALPVALEDQYIVQRQGRKLTQVQVHDMLAETFVQEAPEGVQLQHIFLTSGMVVGAGTLQIQLIWPKQPISGKQSMVAIFRCEDGFENRMLFQVNLQVTKSAKAVVISRGQSLHILLHTANLRIESQGTAQEMGAIGDYIKVLPAVGSKVIIARVVDAGTVEISP